MICPLSDVTVFEETEGFNQQIDQRGMRLKSLVVVWYFGIAVNPKAYI